MAEYVPHTWIDDEVITRDKLNNLETGVQGAKAYTDGRVQELVNTGLDKNYVHTQVNAASRWSIVHNLGKWPSVSVVDSGGNLVHGDVEYTDENELAIIFNVPFSGSAYLN